MNPDIRRLAGQLNDAIERILPSSHHFALVVYPEESLSPSDVVFLTNGSCTRVALALRSIASDLTELAHDVGEDRLREAVIAAEGK